MSPFSLLSGDARVLVPGELLEALQQGAAGQAGAGQGEERHVTGEPAAEDAAEAVPGRYLRQRGDSQPGQPALHRQQQDKRQVSPGSQYKTNVWSNSP